MNYRCRNQDTAYKEFTNLKVGNRLLINTDITIINIGIGFLTMETSYA